MIDTNKITIQNYGSSLMLYIKGTDEKDAHNMWLDLFNFGATGELGTEPEYVAPATISCWTTAKKLKAYFFLRSVFKLSDNKPKKGVKGGVAPEAKALAQAAYDAIKIETFRSVNTDFEAYEFGNPVAERPDEDYKDACLNNAFAAK